MPHRQKAVGAVEREAHRQSGRKGETQNGRQWVAPSVSPSPFHTSADGGRRSSWRCSTKRKKSRGPVEVKMFHFVDGGVKNIAHWGVKLWSAWHLPLSLWALFCVCVCVCFFRWGPPSTHPRYRKCIEISGSLAALKANAPIYKSEMATVAKGQQLWHPPDMYLVVLKFWLNWYFCYYSVDNYYPKYCVKIENIRKGREERKGSFPRAHPDP